MCHVKFVVDLQQVLLFIPKTYPLTKQKKLFIPRTHPLTKDYLTIKKICKSYLAIQLEKNMISTKEKQNSMTCYHQGETYICFLQKCKNVRNVIENDK